MAHREAVLRPAADPVRADVAADSLQRAGQARHAAEHLMRAPQAQGTVLEKERQWEHNRKAVPFAPRRRPRPPGCLRTARQRRRFSHEGGGSTRQRRCLSHKGGGSTRQRRRLSRKGGGSTRQRRRLSRKGGGSTRQRRCLSHEGGGSTRQRRRSYLRSRRGAGAAAP